MPRSCSCTCPLELECPIKGGNISIDNVFSRCEECMGCMVNELNANKYFNIVKFKRKVNNT